MKRSPKTQAQTRRANRGNVPGLLGMAELAMLTAECRPHKFEAVRFPIGGYVVQGGNCRLCHKPDSHDLHQDYQP